MRSKAAVTRYVSFLRFRSKSERESLVPPMLSDAGSGARRQAGRQASNRLKPASFSLLLSHALLSYEGGAVVASTDSTLEASKDAPLPLPFVFFLPSVVRHEAACCSMGCLLYTSPSPRDLSTSRMPSSA